MFDGLVFGWRTAVLLVAIVQLLAIAAGLARVLPNRTANRTLAGLLLVLAAILVPWTIGFAGFYDRWRWLTFAPFQVTLAVAPLLWLYVHALVAGHWPERGWRHLAPALFQFGYGFACFALLPLPAKSLWHDVSALPYDVVTGSGTIAGLALYGRASLRLLGRYRGALAQQRSDDHRYAARWLTRAVAAAMVLLPVWAGYVVWDAVFPIGYRGLMGLYVAIAVFALYLAVEGWRHAALPFPPLAALAPPVAAPSPPERDWSAQATEWDAVVRREGWALDADLSLATLARRLGTNTAYLSRALNAGLGIGFSAYVARLRSEAVADAIRAAPDRDLLDQALECGFSSKASFNRAFAERFGTSPSAWRRTHVSNRK